jgi:pyruvate-ferredoxin/flavodoxin oxidoreductase
MKQQKFKYPGIRAAVDGNAALVLCERESSDAAAVSTRAPSAASGRLWAHAAATGHLNVSGGPLISVSPEADEASAAIAAGLAMTGMRASGFSAGGDIAAMHAALFSAAGKRLPYVLNVAASSLAKANFSMHAGHDDYHCIDDTGVFQLFARDVQAVADLNVIAHRLAELALTPGVVAQDGFLTSHAIETVQLPERELIEEYLGSPQDTIETPTSAQRIIYGDIRRRIPEIWNVDDAAMLGLVQNQDSFMHSVAAQRPFFLEHLPELADRAFEEFCQLTGRRYQPVMTYRTTDADYLILGQGSMIGVAEAVADYLRKSRKLKIGVVNLVMFRPFPASQLATVLQGKKGVAVLERLDQPLASDLPIIREVRSTLCRCLENGKDARRPVWPDLPTFRPADLPALYSGSYGLGGRELQPEGVIAALENMLPRGTGQKFFYLSIDFLQDQPVSPKQRIYQETIEAAYPHVRQLALRGSENPGLLPARSMSVRIHSIGGWGAMSAGKNLAMTLFELANLNVKASPVYGAEKKGQPTTFHLTIAAEPIRVSGEHSDADVVLVAGPGHLALARSLAGLREQGVLVWQSELDHAEDVWLTIPVSIRQTIVDKQIQLHFVDAFRIARQESRDPSRQARLRGMALQGAFFAVSDIMQQLGLSEERLIEAVQHQVQRRFADQSAQVVSENLQVVKRGFDEVQPVPHGRLDEPAGSRAPATGEPPLPAALKKQQPAGSATADIHRFWEETGSLCARGMGHEVIADPFAGLGVIPAATAVFRDRSATRQQHPLWLADNCTGCGECYMVCPDSAIPGLVNEPGQILDTVVKRVSRRGHTVKHLPRAIRQLEQPLRRRLAAARETENVRQIIDECIEHTLQTSRLEPPAIEELTQEFEWFRQELGDFQFALTEPCYTLAEQESRGSGGLFNITINPNTCQGCMQCVTVCPDNALQTVPQTSQSLEQLRDHWDFWQDLPTTPPRFVRVDDPENGRGSLQHLLLDKRNYLSMTGGDSACPGCGEKTLVHLFTSTVEALMQPRIQGHVSRLGELIARLEKHIQLKLVQEIDVGDASAIRALLDQTGQQDVTLATLAEHVETIAGGEPIDPRWLQRVTRTLDQLKQLKARYEERKPGHGRARLGMLNAGGCSSIWASAWPYNPYPFPWASHLVDDSPSVALGVFEGHMSRMAEGFRAIRIAELEIAGEYNPSRHDALFAQFNWEQFSDAEWRLCPPVVAVGGDAALGDRGLNHLSRTLASGKPIKMLVLDTQTHSATGGQASTASFSGQLASDTPLGHSRQGKRQNRKEIGLLALAHRSAYVMQSSMAHPNHLIEGFINGLNSHRPALFQLYAPCQPEHGIADDLSSAQSRLAVESRAFPLFRYDPDAGSQLAERLTLEGNPEPQLDWPIRTLTYQESGQEKSLAVPMTFADFAVTEARFRQHFRVVPRDSWNDNMVPLAEFLELPEDERDEQIPFIWSIDRRRQLNRLLVAEPLVRTCQERRDLWRLLRHLAGDTAGATASVAEQVEPVEPVEIKTPVDVEAPQPHRPDVENRVRHELREEIFAGLMRLAEGGELVNLSEGLEAVDLAEQSGPQPLASTGSESAAAATPLAAAESMTPAGTAPAGTAPAASLPTADSAPMTSAPATAPADTSASPEPASPAEPAEEAVADADEYMAPWIDTELCTSCDECVKINPGIFQYNDDKKAIIKDPEGGPYSDLVKAAEKCTARVIHPGLPRDRNARDIDKWVRRGEKFN